jgi:hypothetical protein
MADLRYVQAAPGCRVLNPDTMKPIPAAGNEAKAVFEIDAERPFWFRRLRDLDVIETDAEGNPIEPAAEVAPAPETPPAPTPKSKPAPAASDAPALDIPAKE